MIAQMEAEAETQAQSMLGWFVNALGPFYLFAILGSGLLLLVVACFTVLLSRRPAVIASLLALVPLPILIGAVGSVQGAISALQVIAMSGATPKPVELAEGVSMCLISLLVGLVVTFPGYLVTALGLIVRTAFSRPSQSQSAS
jgi:hypothetical protein